MIDSFGFTASAGVHPPDPFQLVVGFQRFRNALRICHLLYQPKKKRRLGITPKTALFCCGSERTFYGETAAEEIGVRPIPCLANSPNFNRISRGGAFSAQRGCSSFRKCTPLYCKCDTISYSIFFIIVVAVFSPERPSLGVLPNVTI